MARNARRRSLPGTAASAEIYRQVVESAPNAIVMTDREGKIVLVNKQAEELFGYWRQELLGQPVELLLPERFRPAHTDDRRQYSKAPETRAMGAGRDLFGRRKDGAEIPVEIGLNPIRTSDNTFILASIVDITERKKAEQRFRLAVEAAPNAMIMVDAQGRIVLANAQTEKLFGWAPDELVGKHLETIIPPRFRDKHPSYRRDFFAKPQARPMGGGRELHGWHKEGREVPVEIGLNPIRSGEDTYVLAAIVDITERRELQRKLARSETLAAVGSMAAVIAHEIRNPLGSIVMAAKSLGHKDLSASERETVSRILSDESQRLNRTLQDFLQYARPREPKRETADLNGQVEQIAALLSSNKELAGGIRVDLRLDRELQPFPYDADQFGQVLWNLLLNGVQAMGGDGRLRVETEAAGREALVAVVDSGPGIAPAEIERIFDPFFTTKKKGTGLGLAIARRIVEAHGGRISAANEPRAGARFSVQLPRG